MVDMLRFAHLIYDRYQNSSDKQNKEENCKEKNCEFPFRHTFVTIYFDFGVSWCVRIYSKRNLILVKIKSWSECNHE